MKPCPECNSDRVYRYKKPVPAATGEGPNLLPKLNPGMLSSPKFLPVVCAECGYARYYASEETRSKLETSEHWSQVT